MTPCEINNIQSETLRAWEIGFPHKTNTNFGCWQNVATGQVVLHCQGQYKKKIWVKVVFFWFPKSSQVEIYVQKINIETCIHKAEVLFQVVHVNIEMKHTWSLKLSNFLPSKRIILPMQHIYCTSSIPLKHTTLCKKDTFNDDVVFCVNWVSTVHVVRNTWINLKVQGY